MPVCFLEPSTQNISVARESILTSKSPLIALLILTDASFGFTGTNIYICIYKKQLYSFWRLCAYLPLQREEAGSGADGVAMKLSGQRRKYLCDPRMLLKQVFYQEAAGGETALPFKEGSPIREKTC